jgi:hypothetical protein
MKISAPSLQSHADIARQIPLVRMLFDRVWPPQRMASTTGNNDMSAYDDDRCCTTTIFFLLGVSIRISGLNENIGVLAAGACRFRTAASSSWNAVRPCVVLDVWRARRGNGMPAYDDRCCTTPTFFLQGSVFKSLGLTRTCAPLLHSRGGYWRASRQSHLEESEPAES